MRSLAFLILSGLVAVSCGDRPRLQSKPDGASSLIDGGGEAPAAPASDAHPDTGHPDARDASGVGDQREPEVPACAGNPTFGCVIGGCASDVGPPPECLDGAWKCPGISSPTTNCPCVGLACLPPPPPPPSDAAADSAADRPDAKASDAATDAPNDCRTLGCSSDKYCSTCLTVDQKVLYSCIPNGSAC